MTLLLDENLSPALVQHLAQLVHTVHVRDLGLARASDTDVWHQAKARGLVIVSKDADFHQRSLVLGHPPKVVWIRRGNCATAEIATLLTSQVTRIQEFAADTSASLLVLD